MSKLYVPDCILEKITCMVCKNYLSIFPVLTNADGTKAICGRCSVVDDKSIHDLAYENIAQFLLFPCRNNTIGCKETLTPQNLEEHEPCCVYRKLDCPTKIYSKCQWQGPRVELVKHFEEKHSGLLLKDGKFELNFINTHKEIALFPFNDELFIVKKEVDSRSEKFTCSVHQLRSGNNPEQYKYQLMLVSGNDTYSCKFPEKPTFNEDNITKIENSYIKEKLNDPASVTVTIRIYKIDKDQCEETGAIKAIKKDPNINWELLAELECPICMDFMLPPIYQCVDGHSICSECKPRITDCPLCRKAVKDTKNFALEKMTQFLTFPCKYHKTGCTFSCKYSEIKKHESYCEYGPYKCPVNEVAQCEWKSNSSQIIEHVKISHPTFIPNSNRINIEFNKNERKESFYVIIFSEKAFKLHYKYEENKFYWTVQLVGSLEDSKKFKFEIDIIDVSGSKLRRYAMGLCVPLTENSNSFNDPRKYLTMTLEEIEPLLSTSLSYKVHVVKD